MKSNKERDYRISNIRALAILVVVLGHSIIIYDTGWGYYTSKYNSELLQTVKHIINVFQMPLFFSISGYCFMFSAGKIADSGYRAFVKDKAKRLLIPFAAIAVLWMIPMRLVSAYPYWQGKSLPVILWEIITGKDSGHLWYMTSLFLIFLIAGAAKLVPKNTGSREGCSWFKMIAVLTVLTGVSFMAPLVPDIFFARNVAKYLIWFYFGYYMFGCIRSGKDKVIKLTAATAAVIVIICAAASMVTDSSYHIQYLKTNVYGALITGMAYMIMPQKTCRPVSIISDNSFGIYLFHSPLIYPVFCYLSWLRPVFVVLLTFGVMFPLALGITLMLKRTKAGRLIIGEK